MTNDPRHRPLRVTLDLVPHPATVRARRIPRPDLGRLKDPRWWTRALFGALGARDPLPMVYAVTVADAPKNDVDADPPLEGPAPKDANPSDDWPLTNVQRVLVDHMRADPGLRLVRTGATGGFQVRHDQGQGDLLEGFRTHGGLVKSLINQGAVREVLTPVRGYVLSTALGGEEES